MPASRRPPNPRAPALGNREPDPATAATPAQFLDHMKRLRVWAGNPSLNTLNKRAGGRLPSSTVSDALNRNRLPRLDLVLTYVRACGVQDDEVEEWRQAWYRLMKQEMEISGSPSLESSPPRQRTRRTKYRIAIAISAIAIMTATLTRGCTWNNHFVLMKRLVGGATQSGIIDTSLFPRSANDLTRQSAPDCFASQ